MRRTHGRVVRLRQTREGSRAVGDRITGKRLPVLEIRRCGEPQLYAVRPRDNELAVLRCAARRRALRVDRQTDRERNAVTRDASVDAQTATFGLPRRLAVRRRQLDLARNGTRAVRNDSMEDEVGFRIRREGLLGDDNAVSDKPRRVHGLVEVESAKKVLHVAAEADENVSAGLKALLSDRIAHELLVRQLARAALVPRERQPTDLGQRLRRARAVIAMGFAAPEPRVVELQTRGGPAVDHGAQHAVADRIKAIPVPRRRIAPDVRTERNGRQTGNSRCHRQHRDHHKGSFHGWIIAQESKRAE